MRILALVLLLGLAAPAWAQAIRVTSGEHPGFSRLVLELPAPADWTFGRTDDGYELRVEGQTRFDLSRAFELIPRTRLAALWVDPESGALKLGVGCACHAMPFAFRPGVIVIDLRDGPPPPGSSFELTLEGTAPAALAARSVKRPAPRPGVAPVAPPAPAATYDWLGATGKADPTPATAAPGSLPLDLPDTAAVAMRDAILRQIGRGVAQGVVDPADALPAATGAIDPANTSPRARVRIGPSPGLLAGSDRMASGDMLAAGDACIADDRLAIVDWTTAEPIATQFAAAQTGLFGEFDAPQMAEVEAAVRFYLGAGFGAEAQQLIPLLPANHPERAVWQSLALILDGHADPDGAFAGMERCDTAAAMWAVLSADPADPVTPQETAVRLAFSALPVHLRRHLGPPLVERFLARGDDATAQLIRDAIRRAPGPGGAGVEIMEATIDIATGDSEAAAVRLEGVIAEGGTATPAALVGLVDARLAAGQPVEEETLTALDALLREHAGSEGEAELQRALILAQASRGDFDAAMAAIGLRPEIAPVVWEMLAAGPDSQLLAHAIRPPDDPGGPLPSGTAVRIAERLLALGFADAALSWLESAGEKAGESRLIAASAHLKRRDGRAALAALADLDGTDATALRAEALALVGSPEDTARAWADAGNAAAALRAETLAGNWDRVAAPAEGPWAGAAALVAAPPAIDPAAGPLQQGRARIAESAEARAKIAELLSSVAVPGR